MDPPLEPAAGVLELVYPPLKRLHWVSPLEAPLGVLVSAYKEEVGVLAAGVDQLQLGCPWQLWLLGVGNVMAGAVEAGLLEESTVNWGYLEQLQPHKIS